MDAAICVDIDIVIVQIVLTSFYFIGRMHAFFGDLHFINLVILKISLSYKIIF